MPNRVIREGILTSERVEQLDAAAEVFYRRLMSKVDDHGLYDARPSILRTSLYPLRVDRVREADISRWIAACEKAGLLALYVVAGKPFLQMLDTRWQARSEAKYPLPSAADGTPLQAAASNCAQLLAPVYLYGDVDVDVDVNPPLPSGVPPPARKPAGRSKPATPSGSVRRQTVLPEGFAPSERVKAWAAKNGYRDIAANFEALVSYARRKGARYADWDEALMTAIRHDWAKARPINGQDDPFAGAI